jgi:hypothetical protein
MFHKSSHACQKVRYPGRRGRIPYVQKPNLFCGLNGVLVALPVDRTQARTSRWKSQSHTSFGFQRFDRPTQQQTKDVLRPLTWAPDGKQLWTAILHLQPHILTSVPTHRPVAAAQEKYAWCERELVGGDGEPQLWHWWDLAGPKMSHERYITGFSTSELDRKEKIVLHLPWVITCWSQNKPLEILRPGDILIDDQPEADDLRVRWEKAGGVFIHHKSARETIQALVELGIPVFLDETEDETEDDKKPVEPSDDDIQS